MAADVGSYLPWRISGTYLEACNCEAICPCRTIGGRRGGRSTYGVCMGALSWAIERGRALDCALAGLANSTSAAQASIQCACQDAPGPILRII